MTPSDDGVEDEDGLALDDVRDDGRHPNESTEGNKS